MSCGWIAISTPRATYAIAIGPAPEYKVLEAPPYARNWEYSRTAKQIWDEAKERGWDVKWLGR